VQPIAKKIEQGRACRHLEGVFGSIDGEVNHATPTLSSPCRRREISNG
jgi:hypothetical protein